MGNAEHTVDVLLKTTGVRRGRYLLPRLVQLHALFIAVGKCIESNFFVARTASQRGSRTFQALGQALWYLDPV